MEQKKLDRINELGRKAKAGALSPEEVEEQKALRAEYIAEFRRSLRGTLENTVLERPDGTKEALPKKNK